MIDLRCSIISPRSVGMRILAEYLSDDLIYFHLDGIPYVYNLATGVIEYEEWDKHQLRQGARQAYLEYYHGNPPVEYDKLTSNEKSIEYHKWVSKYLYFKDIIDPTDDVLAVVLAFASRQVKGDELIKGLKAMGFQIPTGFKLTSLYTGGWQIIGPHEGENRSFTVEAFAQLIADE